MTGAGLRSLPILTFDEAALSARLGYVFARRWIEPFESLVSVLWTFARMNGLAGHVLVPHLTRATVDPCEGIAPSTREVDVRLVASTLDVPLKTIRHALNPSGRRGTLHPRLRYCPRCMSLGFHGITHQYLGAMQCPAHGNWLQETCRHCGQASAYRLDARLLDAPFRCADCRRPYGRSTHIGRRPLPGSMRTAFTRAAIC